MFGDRHGPKQRPLGPSKLFVELLEERLVLSTMMGKWMDAEALRPTHEVPRPQEVRDLSVVEGRDAQTGEHESTVTVNMDEDVHGGKGKQGGGAGNMGRGQGGHVATVVTEADDGEDSDKPPWAGKDPTAPKPHGAGDEDSDRPDWAGPNPTAPKPGGGSHGSDTLKGDLYGDVYVILRDEDGVPMLNDGGFVQPIDEDGNPIPLNEEGEVLPEFEELLQEVDFGRLSVVRSPDKVTEHALEEALTTLTEADEIELDYAGRLVAITDGVAKTIDSPLENIALYQAIILESEDLPDGFVESLPDGFLPSSLYAAAADKAGEVTVDQLIYTNSMLGINDPVTGDYYDFSDFEYTRSEVFDGTVTYLKETSPGIYELVEESIMDAVFGGEEYDGVNVGAFAQAADDARAIIAFLHDVPTIE